MPSIDHDAKVVEFEELRRTGRWPALTCRDCQAPAGKTGGCCQRHWHHQGDCCLHCGNDERNA